MYIKSKYRRKRIKNSRSKIRKKKMIIIPKIKLIDKLILILFVLLLLLCLIYLKDNINLYNDPSLYDISKYSINIHNIEVLNDLSVENELDFKEVLLYYSLENHFFVREDEEKSIIELENEYIDKFSLLQEKYSKEKYNKYRELIYKIYNNVDIPVEEENKDKVFAINSYNKKDVYNLGKTESIYFFYSDNKHNELPVISITSGKIKEIGSNFKYGEYIIVENDGIEITYGFLNNKNKILSIGNTVEKGEFLGYMGSDNYNEFVRLSIEYKVTFEDRMINFNTYPFFCIKK